MIGYGAVCIRQYRIVGDNVKKSISDNFTVISQVHEKKLHFKVIITVNL